MSSFLEAYKRQSPVQWRDLSEAISFWVEQCPDEFAGLDPEKLREAIAKCSEVCDRRAAALEALMSQEDIAADRLREGRRLKATDAVEVVEAKLRVLVGKPPANLTPGPSPCKGEGGKEGSLKPAIAAILERCKARGKGDV